MSPGLHIERELMLPNRRPRYARSRTQQKTDLFEPARGRRTNLIKRFETLVSIARHWSRLHTCMQDASGDDAEPGVADDDDAYSLNIVDMVLVVNSLP